MSEGTIVLKFGSSVLRTDADLPNAVHEIYRWTRIGIRVIAVVSAIGDATDHLLAQSRALSSAAEPFASAELLATGERASAALLGLALDRAGVPARVLNPREVSLTVAGPPLDSALVSADVKRLNALLSEYPVLVVPGFFGTDAAGRTHLLGRGGSDLSAVFLSAALNARVRLIKDVDGVYESDPADAKSHSRRFSQLNYTDALHIAGRLIQPKAVSFLREHETCAEVAAFARAYESVVHEGSTVFSFSAPVQPVLKVLLLGLGTVGLGVYQRLFANREHFDVLGCLVRDSAKYRELEIPESLLCADAARILNMRPDIVIDALPGGDQALSLVRHFLTTGAHIVSANKALVAEHGTTLAGLAREYGVTLRYSAAVGGATPMIETIDRVQSKQSIASISAVLNGTCNFVLDACAGGATLAAAVADAKREGFAEADATEDLSGHDAERKLRVLCRHAFQIEPVRMGVDRLDETVARNALKTAKGKRLRQIARATREGDQVHAQVRFESVEADSLFGRLSREWNALEIIDSSGQVHQVTGRGAGRWPATEAVMADLFDVHRDRQKTIASSLKRK